MKVEKSMRNGEKTDSQKNLETSIISLHGEIQDVINTMGPPTHPVSENLEVDSGDEATISSRNSSQNSNTSNRTSNTSFVEVVIKNHHRKCKIIHENVQPTIKPCYSSVQIQTDSEATTQFQESVHSFDKSIKDKNTELNIVEKPQDDSNINTTVFPQRYFKVNASAKKQATVIDLMPTDSRPKLNNFAQDEYSVKRNEKRIFLQKENIFEFNGENYQGKTELYYFDRGNFAFYNTTDYPPIIMADHLAEKTEITAIRFWAETFGMANFILAFVTTFILQLIRFGLFGVVRPLTAGVIQLTSDYFIKPLLASIFNGLVQPPMIFLFNTLSSVRDVCEPIAQTIGFFTRELAVLLKAFRLVDIKKNDQSPV